MLDSQQLSTLINSSLSDAKALEIKKIDVRRMTDITDIMIICHGTSSRHVKALAARVCDTLAEHRIKPASIEGEDLGEWILIDCLDVLVHIMQSQTRDYYDLESLWDDRLTTQGKLHSA